MADRLCICTSGTGRGWQDWLAMLLISGVLLAAIILPQLKSTYPLTYDELVYLRKTRAYDQWLRDGWAHALSGQPLWLFSLEAVQKAEQLPDMHPGVVKLVGLLPHWLVKATLHREGGARLTGAAFLALACCVLYWFSAPRAGRVFAVAGALGLGSMPRLFAHGHFHALDVPIMAMIFLAALLFRRAALDNRCSTAVAFGLVGGIALATKLNAVALFPHLVLWTAVYKPPGWKKTLLAGLLVSPPVFVALWPWTWYSLPDKISQYVAFHSDHFYIGGLWFGRLFGGQTTGPLLYPLVMLVVTMPVIWLALLLGSLPRTLSRRNEADVFLALGLATNVGLLALPGAARYGCERLLMPAFAFAAALAVMSAVHLQKWLSDRSPSLRDLSLLLICALMVVPNICGIVSYYPYCLSYYSSVVGGLPGASRLGLEVTYWGDAFAGALVSLTDPANRGDTFYASNELATGVLDAMMGAAGPELRHHMWQRFVTDQIPPDADWVIVDNSPGTWAPAVWELRRMHQPAITIERAGVPLLWLYRLTGPEVKSLPERGIVP
ncbi:MAG: hypothetical protein GX358_06010 [candidate division WS1 bacterium]|jgi:4-amino-4-deoxy-L-arabinose transferase-like glycosyltransferase|nr:hypothetical protein [candidate division WS1 bacterium]